MLNLNDFNVKRRGGGTVSPPSSIDLIYLFIYLFIFLQFATNQYSMCVLEAIRYVKQLTLNVDLYYSQLLHCTEIKQ